MLMKKELIDDNKRLREENKKLKKLCDKYEEEHKTVFEEWKKTINIINELEKELKEDYKIWMCNSRSNGKSVKFGIDVCKTHFYNRLQELKGVDKE